MLTYYLAMKSPTTVKVGVVYGNQVKTRRCYALAMKEKGNSHQKTNTIVNSTDILEAAQFVEELST